MRPTHFRRIYFSRKQDSLSTVPPVYLCRKNAAIIQARARMHAATSTFTSTVYRWVIDLDHRATPAQPVWVASSRSALRFSRRSRIYRPTIRTHGCVWQSRGNTGCRGYLASVLTRVTPPLAVSRLHGKASALREWMVGQRRHARNLVGGA
jgi:hypothetical protein